MPDMDPRLTLALATSALNSSEFHRGCTSLQWAFGKQTEFGDEELRRHLSSVKLPKPVPERPKPKWFTPSRRTLQYGNR